MKTKMSKLEIGSLIVAMLDDFALIAVIYLFREKTALLMRWLAPCCAVLCGCGCAFLWNRNRKTGIRYFVIGVIVSVLLFVMSFFI